MTTVTVPIPEFPKTTMTSREIAELTGKELGHVHRDIRAMLDELKKDDPNLNHPQEDKDLRGFTTCFHLNRELTETLLTGYSASARLKVIRRWHDLEEQARNPITALSRLDLLKLALDSEEQRLQLEIKVEALAPKAEALDRLAPADGSFCIWDAAKTLQ
jgi:phage regulator Rha-like protein